MSDHVLAALRAASSDRLIYDLSGIERQYHALLAELPGVSVRFAMKACPVPAVLSVLADAGSGFDAASPGEIRLALDSGARPDDVHYGNTVKSDADIAATRALGVTTFATDSLEDVRAIAANAPGARVFCRMTTTGLGALWGLTSKFGTEDAVSVLLEAERLGLVPAGLSVHVGSQQMTAQAWSTALDDLVSLVEKLAAAGVVLDHVNLGGGLPAEGYYSRDGVRLTPPTAEIFGAIRAGVERLRAAGVPSFLVEPGRHLVADHGTIRAHVKRLTTRAERWLYLSCGKFNGLYETDQLRYRLTFPSHSTQSVRAVVAGPTCDSDDSFGDDPVLVPAGLASGDPVWIHSAGAYATSYTTQGFNGFDPLPVVAVRSGRVRPIEPGDWDRIGEIEAAEYGARGLAEGRELLKSRWGKETSFVLESEGRVDGYVIALPYPLDTSPDPAIAERVVHRSSNLHLHDIVVSEELRGRGWAGRMTGRLVERARRSGYQRISLVALGGVAGFWAGQGFESRPDVPLPDGYGPGAVYMSRVIADEERA